MEATELLDNTRISSSQTEKSLLVLSNLSLGLTYLVRQQQFTFSGIKPFIVAPLVMSALLQRHSSHSLSERVFVKEDLNKFCNSMHFTVTLIYYKISFYLFDL